MFEEYLVRFYKNDKDTGVTIGLSQKIGSIFDVLFREFKTDSMVTVKSELGTKYVFKVENSEALIEIEMVSHECMGERIRSIKKGLSK